MLNRMRSDVVGHQGSMSPNGVLFQQMARIVNGSIVTLPTIVAITRLTNTRLANGASTNIAAGPRHLAVLGTRILPSAIDLIS